MKVISGTLKGRKIDGYNLDGTRPTMDRVKESLFAMIQNYIGESICLDLFAGSGNLGIEAISEGATFVYFNDNNKKAVEVIKQNVKKFNILEKAEILNMSHKKALNELTGKKIDIIFLDPPYKTNYIEESIKLIDSNNLLSDNGIIVCESSDLNKIIYTDNFQVLKEKKYGDKWVVILEKI